MVKNQNEYFMNRYYSRKSICVERLGGKCVVCGNVKDLQFDHINPENKEFEIADKLLSNFDKVLSELEKCQLLCFNCHTLKTSSERKIVEHGTYAVYKRDKCRCQDCKKALAVRRKTWKSNLT